MKNYFLLDIETGHLPTLVSSMKIRDISYNADKATGDAQRPLMLTFYQHLLSPSIAKPKESKSSDLHCNYPRSVDLREK